MSTQSPGRGPAQGARARLAELLLTREVGQRIPSVQELQAHTGTGAGTVVKALRELEDGTAVVLQARGRLGTVVTSRHVGRLWEAAQLGAVRISMPPPGPVEQQAVIDVLHERFGQLGLPVSVEFRGGSRNRLLEVFHERAHIALTSATAFEHHRQELSGLLSVDLGENSYYARDSLVLVTRRDDTGPPQRVGIDRGSYDHEQLTLAEFGHREVSFVPCLFYRAPADVLRRDVDAVVWHRLPTVIPPELAGLETTPLSSAPARKLLPVVSHAALVTRALDAAANAVLREVAVRDIAQRRQALEARSSDGVDGPAFWPR